MSHIFYVKVQYSLKLQHLFNILSYISCKSYLIVRMRKETFVNTVDIPELLLELILFPNRRRR